MAERRRERVIVLANRAPVKHELSEHGVAVTRSASGLVTALEPLLAEYSGTWVAHAAGSADVHVVDALGGIDVPPANPRYRVRYVPLPDDEHRGYYYGFANEGLWPLCHTAGVAPIFRRSDFEMYRAANARFADAVADEAGRGPSIVLVQDYHFALAPHLLRQRMPHGRVASFWHIPWPRPRAFHSCPWAPELLEGLLGSDIVGLQTEDDCRNFLGCVEALHGADVDSMEGTVTYRGRLISVRAYPVGIDCAHDAIRSLPSHASCRASVCRELQLAGGVRIGVGIDRLDYTKGINEKFLAIERLLECEPELVGRFAFLQVAEPSRDCLSAYRAERERVSATRDRINARFGGSGVLPIHLFEEHHEPREVYRYYRAADFCYVNSLHDGMNLVAKEFVAAREDEDGVLVLSERAGAARQLRAALIVDPQKVDASARVLAQALHMPRIEQVKRMRILRDNVRSFDASWWATRMVEDTLDAPATIDRRIAAVPEWSSAVA